MRASRPAIFLGLGVILALLSGLVVFSATQQAASTPRIAALTDTTPVVVAVADIPALTVLTPDLVALRDYPRTLVPAGALTSIDDATKQATLTKIPAGAPITAAQVAVSGTAGKSLIVEKGKVLVAFPVTDALVTAGQIKPGDHVDILATITPPSLPAPVAGATPIPAALLAQLSQVETPVTQTIIQNLEVVDIVGKNVLTFIVDHQTSLVLKNLRDTSAVIDIVVRSRQETDQTRTTPVDNSYIVRTFRFR